MPPSTPIRPARAAPAVGADAPLFVVLGSLGEDERVETFEFERMTVSPRRGYGSRRFKVATDGELSWLQAPLSFGVAQQPLYLLKAPHAAAPV